MSTRSTDDISTGLTEEDWAHLDAYLRKWYNTLEGTGGKVAAVLWAEPENTSSK